MGAPKQQYNFVHNLCHINTKHQLINDLINLDPSAPTPMNRYDDIAVKKTDTLRLPARATGPRSQTRFAQKSFRVADRNSVGNTAGM